MSRPNNLPGRAGWLVIAGVFAMAVPAVAQVQRVSVATDGTQANGTSFRGAISGNGHVVVFSSQATNLVANDTNDAPDVFVRDLVAHTTTRVSVTSDGSQGNAPSGAGLAVGEDALAASFDGSIVAFTSYAALVADDTNPCGSTAACADVYVRDLGTGTTTRVSVASDGTQGNGPSFAPSLSADGRYVVFTSSASNLVPGDTNGTDDIFLHDRVLHTTTRVSVLEDGGQSGYSHAHGTICADGHTVAFTSYYRATLNQPDRYNGFVFVRSLTTNTLRTEVIEQVDQPVIYMVPALSSDGTKLAVQVATYSQTPTSILGASFTTLIDRTTGRQFTADIVRQTLAVRKATAWPSMPLPRRSRSPRALRSMLRATGS